MCPKSHLTTHREVPYLRRPKTFNEMKQGFVDEAELDELTAHQSSHLIRGARKPLSLPNAWDDKPVSLWKHREFTKRWMSVRSKYRSPV